ncbi:hypothetical protein WT81_19450 [Burkholderia stagnalis]|nr:hypothetical protein WT80_21910 [Burkholderia stagnalis]KWK57350.1 hypothetical protein WT81_19450 [Burkholderia stagnalis]
MQAQRPGEHFCRSRRRHDNDPILIADNEVARRNAHVANADWFIYGFHLHAVFAGAHKPADGVERIAHFVSFCGIATDAVDDRSGDTTVSTEPTQYPAPHRAIRAAGVIQHHYCTGWRLIEVIADRAGVG